MIHRQAAAYLATPYVPQGRTPAGWDCWGCVAYLRAELFGLETPSWAHAYVPAEAYSRARVEALILAGLSAWREVEAGPGAVALLTLYGRPVHVGLMLDRTEMIHATHTGGTMIAPVDREWPARRRRGFYECRPTEATPPSS